MSLLAREDVCISIGRCWSGFTYHDAADAEMAADVRNTLNARPSIRIARLGEAALDVRSRALGADIFVNVAGKTVVAGAIARADVQRVGVGGEGSVRHAPATAAAEAERR